MIHVTQSNRVGTMIHVKQFNRVYNDTRKTMIHVTGRKLNE